MEARRAASLLTGSIPAASHGLYHVVKKGSSEDQAQSVANQRKLMAMDDRKYRQRGYRDDDRERQSTPKPGRPAPEPGAPAGARRISGDAPKTINMPGYREVVRCAQ